MSQQCIHCYLDKGTQCSIQMLYDNKGNIGWAANANEKDNVVNKLQRSGSREGHSKQHHGLTWPGRPDL